MEIDREPRKVLVIDASSSTLYSLKLLLTCMKYTVETARSLGEAVGCIHKNRPDIIVTGLELPDCRGAGVLKHLNDHFPEPGLVVVFTADRQPGIREACLRQGCAAFLEKPAEPEALYRTLQAVSEAWPRAFVRLKTSLPVIVGDGTVMGGAERTECLTGLSEGGLYVATRYPQPKNAVTPVRLVFPGFEIRAKAVVLYVNGANGNHRDPGMGMKFIEISDADRAAIRSFVRSWMTIDCAAAEMARDFREGRGKAES